jgi:hypothetical protein
MNTYQFIRTRGPVILVILIITIICTVGLFIIVIWAWLKFYPQKTEPKIINQYIIDPTKPIVKMSAITLANIIGVLPKYYSEIMAISTDKVMLSDLPGFIVAGACLAFNVPEIMRHIEKVWSADYLKLTTRETKLDDLIKLYKESDKMIANKYIIIMISRLINVSSNPVKFIAMRKKCKQFGAAELSNSICYWFSLTYGFLFGYDWIARELAPESIDSPELPNKIINKRSDCELIIITNYKEVTPKEPEIGLSNENIENTIKDDTELLKTLNDANTPNEFDKMAKEQDEIDKKLSKPIGNSTKTNNEPDYNTPKDFESIGNEQIDDEVPINYKSGYKKRNKVK